MRNQGGPVRQFGDDISTDAICPVVYSSPPTSGPQTPADSWPPSSGAYAPAGRAPSTRGGGSGTLDTASDRASLADDYSLPSSPAHSVQSELNGSCGTSPLHDDFRGRRVSLDYAAAEPPRRAAAPASRNERRGFLPRDQTQLTPMVRGGAGSPLYDLPAPRGSGATGGTSLFMGSPSAFSPGGGSPLFPSQPGKPLSGGSSPARPHLAGSAGGSPLFSSYAPAKDESRGGSPLFSSYGQYTPDRGSTAQQQQQQQQQHLPHHLRVGSATASPVHQRAATGLRERVLMRSSSGQSQDFLRTEDVQAEDDIPESKEANCLNFSETESVCAEKELEKQTLDGMLIVPLPSRLAAGSESSEYVLYALYFAKEGLEDGRCQDLMPLLPGDDSIKLLFPKNLQNAANCVASQPAPKNQGVKSAFFDCKPYQPAKPSLSEAARGTPIATFGQYKPIS